MRIAESHACAESGEASTSDLCLPAACLPGANATPVGKVLQTVRGAFLDTFSDIMEPQARSRPGSTAPPSASLSRSGSARAPTRRAAPATLPRETLFQKLQRVSSQPALAPAGPTISHIGEGLLRSGAGRDPLSANGGVPRLRVPSKGKAD